MTPEPERVVREALRKEPDDLLERAEEMCSRLYREIEASGDDEENAEAWQTDLNVVGGLLNIAVAARAALSDSLPDPEQARVQQITITRDGDWMVVSDEDGEFARVDGLPRALLPYIEGLLYECGTVKPKGLMSDDGDS